MRGKCAENRIIFLLKAFSRAYATLRRWIVNASVSVSVSALNVPDNEYETTDFFLSSRVATRYEVLPAQHKDKNRIDLLPTHDTDTQTHTNFRLALLSSWCRWANAHHKIRSFLPFKTCPKWCWCSGALMHCHFACRHFFSYILIRIHFGTPYIHAFCIHLGVWLLYGASGAAPHFFGHIQKRHFVYLAKLVIYVHNCTCWKPLWMDHCVFVLHALRRAPCTGWFKY